MSLQLKPFHFFCNSHTQLPRRWLVDSIQFLDCVFLDHCLFSPLGLLTSCVSVALPRYLYRIGLSLLLLLIQLTDDSHCCKTCTYDQKWVLETLGFICCPFEGILVFSGRFLWMCTPSFLCFVKVKWCRIEIEVFAEILPFSVYLWTCHIGFATSVLVTDLILSWVYWCYFI